MKLDKISSIYPYITDVNDFELVVYTDASYAKLSDGYSSVGDIILKKKKPKTVFYLSSTKNKCVVKSAKGCRMSCLTRRAWKCFLFKACACCFLSNFYFQPNDSPSKTMKNVFYFI